jgi:hypothetical protein
MNLSSIDKRKNGYYPIIDTDQFVNDLNKKYKNYTNIEENDNNLQFFKLRLSNNYNKVDERWLEFEILEMLKYGIGKTNIFKFLDDKDDQKICICQLLEKYNIFSNLNRYFQYDENCIYYSKIFGGIKNIGIISKEIYEKLEERPKFTQYSYFDTEKDKEKEIEKQETDDDNTSTIEKTDTNSNDCLSLDEKREKIEKFFDSENGQEEEHTLEESICKPLIGQQSHKPFFYYYKDDPKVENIYLKSIEDHIRLKYPERHKAKLLELLRKEEKEKNN